MQHPSQDNLLLDPSLSSLASMDRLLQDLAQKYGIRPERFLGLLKDLIESRQQDLIPVELFADRSAGVLETLIRFLKDEQGHAFKTISGMLNRDNRTIWASYHRAITKTKKLHIPKESSYSIPVHAFADRTLGPSECLVRFLHDQERLGFTSIGRLLHRDPRTIWASYHNAQEKLQQAGGDGQ